MPDNYHVRDRFGNVEQWKNCTVELGPRCANCHVISLDMFACDYSAGGVTCNMILCDACAQPIEGNAHRCPAHYDMKIKE